MYVNKQQCFFIILEHLHEKTNNLGFRPGPVQSQKIARSLKLWMKEEEGWYYPCIVNKGADQLRGYLCFRIGKYPVFS